MQNSGSPVVAPRYFPQMLLVPQLQYPVQLYLTNSSTDARTLKFTFEGDGLRVLSTSLPPEPTSFQPNEQRLVEVRVQPARNGQVRLIVRGFRQRQVEVVEKRRVVKDPPVPPAVPPKLPVEEWAVVDVDGSSPELGLERGLEAAWNAAWREALNSPVALENELGASAALDSSIAEASSVEDSAERNSSLAVLATRAARTDAERCREALSRIDDPGVRREAVRRAAIAAALAGDLDLAESLILDHLTDGEVSGELVALSSTLAMNSPAATKDLDGLGSQAESSPALSLALRVRDPASRDQLLGRLATFWALSRPKLAVKAVKAIDDQGTADYKRAEVARLVASVDPVLAGSLVGGVSDSFLKQAALVEVVKGAAVASLAAAVKLVEKVEDTLARDALLEQLAYRLAADDPTRAVEVAGQIADVGRRVGTMLLVAPHLSASGDAAKAISVLTSSFEVALAVASGEVTSLLADTVTTLAKYASPAEAHAALQRVGHPLREQLTDAVFDQVYRWEEIKATRLEDERVVEVHYAFSALVEGVTDPLRRFSELSGNVSPNLLAGKPTSVVSFLFPFRHSYSVLPVLDRVYNELFYQEGKEYSYLYFPSNDLNDGEEASVLVSALQAFFVRKAEAFPGVHTVFLADFIPDLIKPTVIVGSDAEVNEAIRSAVSKCLGDAVELIIDDGLFSGGKIHDLARSTLKPPNFKLVNLALTYAFLRDPNLLRGFISCFTR
ncbi:MAG: hypothetical protein Kow0069_27670 [Promethearchaeota archaeon]